MPLTLPFNIASTTLLYYALVARHRNCAGRFGGP